MQLAVPNGLPKWLDSTKRIGFGHHSHFRLGDTFTCVERCNRPNRKRDRGTAKDCDQIANDSRVHFRNNIVRSGLMTTVIISPLLCC